MVYSDEVTFNYLDFIIWDDFTERYSASMKGNVLSQKLLLCEWVLSVNSKYFVIGRITSKLTGRCSVSEWDFMPLSAYIL